MKNKNILIFLFSILFFGCKIEQDMLHVRVKAISTNTDDEIEFCVYPETMDGVIATGASVCVVNESNVVKYLDYDSKTQCFKGYVQNTGCNYNVVVKSMLYPYRIDVDVVHRKLNTKLELMFFRDESGNSALSLDRMNSFEKLQLSWNSLGDDIVYNVEIRSDSEIYFSNNTYASFIEIQNDVLPKNKTLFLTIKAQSVNGDCFFESSNYYSSSVNKSSSFCFIMK